MPPAGRIVVIRLPDRPRSVKRVVATEATGADGARIRVEGDNPLASADSRQLGWLPTSFLDGTVLARIWPRPRLLVRPASAGTGNRIENGPP
jgi:hypothetical protein